MTQCLQVEAAAGSRRQQQAGKVDAGSSTSSAGRGCMKRACSQNKHTAPWCSPSRVMLPLHFRGSVVPPDSLATGACPQDLTVMETGPAMLVAPWVSVTVRYACTATARQTNKQVHV